MEFPSRASEGGGYAFTNTWPRCYAVGTDDDDDDDSAADDGPNKEKPYSRCKLRMTDNVLCFRAVCWLCLCLHPFGENRRGGKLGILFFSKSIEWRFSLELSFLSDAVYLSTGEIYFLAVGQSNAEVKVQPGLDRVVVVG